MKNLRQLPSSCKVCFLDQGLDETGHQMHNHLVELTPVDLDFGHIALVQLHIGQRPVGVIATCKRIVDDFVDIGCS